MVLRYRGLGQSGYSRLADAVDLADLLPSMELGVPIDADRRSASDPLVIAYWPLARTNQFQTLLYNQSWRYGSACLPFVDEAELAEVPWAGPMACHFHWLASIGTADDDVAAAIGRFEALLGRLKQQHRKIVWTVHNVLPHDQPDIEGAVRIRRLMVDAADAIHVMNERTAELVEPYFSLGDTPVFYSPHPSYLGDFPNTVTREEARFQLGIRPGATVFLCFGAILRYKGIEDLLAAAEMLARDRPELDWTLVVAGDAKDEELIRRIRAIETLDGRLSINAHKVPIDDVQYYFNAADYSVCPYRQALNSGAALLSLSFGVPLVAPATAAFSDLLARGTGIGYESGEHAALAGALAAAIEADPAGMRRNAIALAEERRADKASARFFEELTGRLGLRGGKG